MGDEVVKLNRTQFDDLKNSVHDIRNHASQISKDLDGKILTGLKNASTAGIAEKLDAINETIRAGFASVVEAIANIQPLPPPQPKLLEVTMDFVVKDDHADVPFSLSLGAVTDAEGNVIPDAQVDTSVESDNPAAVSVTYDPATKSGVASFGSPGSATVRANVNSAGVLLGTGTAGFTVTTGDPAAIAGVDLAFEGLEEAPPA